jgi:hypothetical protein
MGGGILRRIAERGAAGNGKRRSEDKVSRSRASKRIGVPKHSLGTRWELGNDTSDL